MALVGIAPNPNSLRTSVLGPASISVGTNPDTANVQSAQVALPSSILGQPMAWWVGLALLLLLFKFISEHERLPFNPAHVHIGGYNFAAITVNAIVGIVLLKAIFNRWPVYGLTQVINAA
jgi:hypothetical protein